MTIEEAVEILEEVKIMDDSMYAFNDSYLAALDMAIDTLKMQEPVPPVTSEEQYGDHLRHCPTCGKSLPNSGEYGKSCYCYKCGQAVKWK